MEPKQLGLLGFIDQSGRLSIGKLCFQLGYPIVHLHNPRLVTLAMSVKQGAQLLRDINRLLALWQLLNDSQIALQRLIGLALTQRALGTL